MVKGKYADKQSGFKTKEVTLIIIILPNDVNGDDRVDGGDDGGGGRDDGGGRYFSTYFLSFYFLFLSFLDFSPLFV